MIETAAAPVVACLPVDITRQHNALDLEIGELRAVIASCPATRRTGSYQRLVAVLVSRLEERLEAHFTEESDSVYVVAASLHPGLAADLARFQDAHAEILATGRRLAEQLRAPTAPPAAVPQTLHWLDDLTRHEIEERTLLGGDAL